MTIREIRNKIDEYTKLDASEIQEVYVHLCIVYDSYSHYVENETVEAIENEFYEILAYYEENWEIEEVTETIPEETRTYKELVQKF